MKKTDTTELDRIQEVHEDSQRIGEFLEWLLGEWSGSECDECGDETFIHMIQTREQLLANYFEIDLAKAEKERQALLDAVRAENNERKT